MAYRIVEKPTARVIYVAPIRTNQETPLTEWVQVTDGPAMDRNRAWSPDGSLLDFWTQRDAFRCIWAQWLEAATRKPVGRLFAVAHFHQSAQSLMNIDGAGQVNRPVTPDRIVLAMGEFMGNVWTAEVR